MKLRDLLLASLTFLAVAAAAQQLLEDAERQSQVTGMPHGAASIMSGNVYQQHQQ